MIVVRFWNLVLQYQRLQDDFFNVFPCLSELLSPLLLFFHLSLDSCSSSSVPFQQVHHRETLCSFHWKVQLFPYRFDSIIDWRIEWKQNLLINVECQRMHLSTTLSCSSKRADPTRTRSDKNHRNRNYNDHHHHYYFVKARGQCDEERMAENGYWNEPTKISKKRLQNARLEIIEMMSVSFQRNHSALSVGGRG